MLVAAGWLAPAEAAHFALSCVPGGSLSSPAASLACTLLAVPSYRVVQLEAGGCGGGSGGGGGGGGGSSAVLPRLVLGPPPEATGAAAAAAAVSAAAASDAARFYIERTPAADAPNGGRVAGAAASAAVGVGIRYTLRSLGGCCVEQRAPMHLRGNATVCGSAGDAAAGVTGAVTADAARVVLHWMASPPPERRLSPWVAPLPPADGAPPAARLSLRLLQWNIRDGCADDASRLGGIGRWVRASGVDVLGLNELNGWTPGTFGRLAAALGLPHSVLLETGTGYHLGICSRWPMVLDEANVSHPYHHGVLTVQVGGVRVTVTHLSPADATARLRETRALLEGQSSRNTPAAASVLMGDLNSLSPLDRDEHAAVGLADRLAADTALARKFLLPATASTASEDEPDAAGGGAAGAAIDYAPMGALIDGGLHDAGHATSLRAAREARAAGADDGDDARNDDPLLKEEEVEVEGEEAPSTVAPHELHNHSVPTMINEDFMHAAPMRLDYAMLSPSLRHACEVSTRLVRDADTERLSDHYPLLTDLDCWETPQPLPRDMLLGSAAAVGGAGGTQQNPQKRTSWLFS